MATVAAPPPSQRNPRTLSYDGLVTIVGAVALMLTIIFFNQNLGAEINLVRTELKADIDRLESDIQAVRMELKTDIEAVRTELKADIANSSAEVKADIVRLEADIQRLDDRLFAVIVPPTPEEASEASS